VRITIHQPEHFPYMGFFQKIQNADIIVLLDNVKFRKNYFQNRNKFINKQGVEEWFGVPVGKKSNSFLINEIFPANVTNWKNKVVNKIKHNFNYDLERIYSNNTLCEINVESIKWAMSKLNIDKEMILASNLKSTGHKSKLLSNICKELNAKTYISGPSGKDYLDENIFDDINIEYFCPDVENYYSCIYNIYNKIF